MATAPGQPKPNQMTTERIQEVLEENFKFIRAIAEQQNLGRMQEVNQYQQKLQENLMLLAAVADTYTPGAGATQAAPAPAAQAFRPPAPAVAPNPAAALVQFPAGAGGMQQAPMVMTMPGAAGQPTTVQLTQQQLQVMQQALRQQQALQQQQALGQAQAQALNQLAGMGLAPGGQAGVGGFQLPAPPPLNLG